MLVVKKILPIISKRLSKNNSYQEKKEFKAEKRRRSPEIETRIREQKRRSRKLRNILVTSRKGKLK